MSPHMSYLAIVAAMAVGIGLGWAIGAMAETPPRLALLPLVTFVGMGIFIVLYGPTAFA